MLKFYYRTNLEERMKSGKLLLGMFDNPNIVQFDFLISNLGVLQVFRMVLGLTIESATTQKLYKVVWLNIY